MANIDTVFFDLDRTLWDFEKNSLSVLRILYEDFKLNNYIPSFEEFLIQYKAINGCYWKDYGKGIVTKEQLESGRFTDTLKVFNIENKEIGKSMNEQYIQLSPYQTYLLPETRETLTELKNYNYRLHIITNGFKEVQLMKIKNSKISSFFDTVLSSEEVGESKPHPLVFREAMQRAKTKANQSIMIGDDFNADVIGAENVGIHGILFDPEKKYEQSVNVDRIENLKEIPSHILTL